MGQEAGPAAGRAGCPGAGGTWELGRMGVGSAWGPWGQGSEKGCLPHGGQGAGSEVWAQAL